MNTKHEEAAEATDDMLSRLELLAGAATVGATIFLFWRIGRGHGREEDLHHSADERHALGLHRHRPRRGVHAVHVQRRRDSGRVRAPGCASLMCTVAAAPGAAGV